MDANVDAMVEAARIVEQAAPDLIDINFGCPVKKVAGKGAGAGMLRDVPKMLAITRAVVNAVKLPVTVKTRLGWDHDSRIIVDLAEALQDCGIAALTVHGRTRSQMYTGNADWEEIARIKENPRFTIPLIGNGDICTPQQAADAFDRYGVDAVMIGRAAIGAPWIFRSVKSYLTTGTAEHPSTAEMFSLLRRQIRESIERIDPYAASCIYAGIWLCRRSSKASLRSTPHVWPCFKLQLRRLSTKSSTVLKMK